MLKKDKLIYFVLIFILLCSCQEERKKKIELINIDFNDDIAKEYQLAHFSSYEGIYNGINDSINKWISDSLAVTKSIFFENYWQVDSVICFNEDSTRLFTTVNKSDRAFLDSIFDYI